MLAALPLMAWANGCVVKSPNGQLSVSASDKDGLLTYTIVLDGRQVLEASRLGFKADFGDFTAGLSIKSSRVGAMPTKHYKMRQTKQAEATVNASHMVLDVENGKGQKMQVEFAVQDNDIAFRYVIPRQLNNNPKCATIFNEVSSFRLPEGTTTFLCPQIGAMAGWERTKPSYEEDYTPDAPMPVKSQFGQGYTFPCLFKVPSESRNSWMLISETGVTSQYCGSHLSDFNPETGYTIAFPQAGENNGNGTPYAAIALPGTTPWRTITVGTTLAPIVETTVSYDMVEPLYEPTTDYKAGRYTWSWLLWQDKSINYDDQVKFIDLAAAMGYEYCLVDNWWDTQIGRDRIEELSKYAQSKGVSLMLWYNSNGQWSDAPQTPRNCMSTSIARDREMAWLKRIGVKGIKVDFFAGDKQETMKLYEDILFDANRYGLQVIFHGCTIPRGWEVMYPNYVASEAVLASENLFFTQQHCDTEAFELTMHPFCRNAVGTMDWGGVVMNRRMAPDNASRHTRRTTDVFEMATGITNQSAINCVAIQPNNLMELPQFELDFLKSLPVTWDETCFIDGYPGRYVVLARRHGSDWYVAGLNACKEPLTLTLALPMFDKGSALDFYTDDKKGTSLLKTLKVDKKGCVKVTMQPNGGLIIKQQ